MAGGARPDPFRTRKLSRRAPMVLRGQPVGEQGAADRWTALDPFRAGRGGAAGDSLRRPPLFSPYRSAEGPVGPFFHAGILPCLQVGVDEPRALPAPRLSCFAADPPGLGAGGPFGTRPLPPAIGPRPVRWAPARFPSPAGRVMRL